MQCTCAVARRRWRRGGDHWRERPRRVFPPRPRHPMETAAFPWRALPVYGSSLLQRTDPHGPHHSTLANSAWHVIRRPGGGLSPAGGDGSARKDGCAPRRPGPGSLPPRRRRVPCVDTRGRWRPSDRSPDSRTGADRGTTSVVTCMQLIVTCRILSRTCLFGESELGTPS
jgi:hypothetical protein